MERQTGSCWQGERKGCWIQKAHKDNMQQLRSPPEYRLQRISESEVMNENERNRILVSFKTFLILCRYISYFWFRGGRRRTK